MPRILSIWLPQLPLDRLTRRGDARLDGAFAIIAEEKNAWRITHTNRLAAAAGVGLGQSLADARAICPALLTEQSDPMREGLLLHALWRWADSLSPRVSLDPPDGLLLDIAGCAHLFGGEAAMARHAQEQLRDLMIPTQIGIADTKRAAKALARYGPTPINTADTGQTARALHDLPIIALGIDTPIAAELARAGLTKIGQLYAQKSSELARRFGLKFTQSLNAATGQSPDPVTPKITDPTYAARMTLPEPIGLLEDMEGVLSKLTEHVCAKLDKDRKGARQFRLTVRCVDTGDHMMAIGFARPCFEAGPVLRQFSHPLAKLEIEYGADWFRLSAHHVEPIHLKQLSMGEETKRADHRLQLIDTLGNRIGFDHIRIFKSCDSHLPEDEFEQVEAVNTQVLAWQSSPRERPIRLFTPPEFVTVDIAGRPPPAFTWRRMAFETKDTKGPERLTPRWHSSVDLRTRDYWRVQTAQGRRLWLLTYPGHDRDDWFVAGEFA